MEITAKDYKKYFLLLIYICDRNDPKWQTYIDIFDNLNLPTIISSGMGHHNGLSYQMVLDVKTMNEGIQLSKMINNALGTKTLIVIGPIEFHPSENIATKYTDDLVKTGRFFDKMVSKGKRGIFYKKER